jgi:N-acyl-D-aspartate/D-glutamate deacylase
MRRCFLLIVFFLVLAAGSTPGMAAYPDKPIRLIVPSAALRAKPAATNCALLVGHTTLRVTTMDDLDEAATYEAPIARAHGIETVIVNGAIVWRDGRPTGARPGRVLARETQ